MLGGLPACNQFRLERRCEQVERLPRHVSVRCNLLIRQGAIEHVHARGDEIAILDRGNHSAFPCNSEKHWSKDVAQRLARRS